MAQIPRRTLPAVLGTPLHGPACRSRVCALPTEIISDCSKPTLQGMIRGRVDPRTVINSDGWRGYSGLVDLGYGHFHMDHSRDEFTKAAVHINGIEGFWGLAKVRLAKFKGLPRHAFHLHLKETEWRYNHRHANKYKIRPQYLRGNVLS